MAAKYYTVKGHDDLMAVGEKAGDWVRLLSDQTLVIHGRSGNLARRVDGLPWPHAAYRVWTPTRRGEIAKHGSDTLVEPKGAWHDTDKPQPLAVSAAAL